jgi:pimeloyl-ACP methyl ester carboxylesterase
LKRGYANIKEGQVHYRIEGSGDPIILLHSAVASSNEFRKTMTFLSKNYRAIALDYLGNGDSDPAPYAYDVRDHARTVVSFMDNLGIKKSIIVGQHIGGKVGLEMAVTWPERVTKLAISSIGYYAEGSDVIKDPPNFRDQVEIKPDGSHLMEWWRRSDLWGHPLEIVEEKVIEYIKAGPRGEEIHWAGRDYDPRPKLPLINCPTLILSATHDPFYALAENIHKLVPKSKLTIIENGPTEISRVWPKEFADAILSFLSTP